MKKKKHIHTLESEINLDRVKQTLVEINLLRETLYVYTSPKPAIERLRRSHCDGESDVDISNLCIKQTET